MREDIEKRIVDEANYIIETGDTVRGTAKVFHFSKSTVHKDVTERLLKIDKQLYIRPQHLTSFSFENYIYYPDKPT